MRIDFDFLPVVTVSTASMQADGLTYMQDVVELGVVRSNLLLVHDTAHIDARLLQQEGKARLLNECARARGARFLLLRLRTDTIVRHR